VTARHTLAICCLLGILLVAGCLGAGDGARSSQPSADRTVDAPAVGTPAATANATLDVHVIAVGQATSILIVGPAGETMLYDTGHYDTDGEAVLYYLDEQGIDRIDHLVVSHSDADHIGGAGPIIDHYESERAGVGTVHDPGLPASTQTYGEFLAAVEQHNVTRDETHEGDAIGFGDVTVSVLGPPVPYLDNRTRNENSLVLRLGYGNTSFLLSGDAEADQERYLAERYGTALNATVLTAGHHGSYSSSREPFLDAVSPERVVISSPYDSEYGHPDETVLTRLTARAIPAYWTGTHGTTTFTSNGETVTVRTQERDPIVATALRSGEPFRPGATDTSERRETLGNGPDQYTRLVGATDAIGPRQHLELVWVQSDAPGDDYENPRGEFLVFQNTGQHPLALTNWTVHDSVGHRYTFPETTLAPGQRLTLHTGSGVDNGTHHYWNESDPVWNNDGDIVLVTTPDGYPTIRQPYD